MIMYDIRASGTAGDERQTHTERESVCNSCGCVRERGRGVGGSVCVCVCVCVCARVYQCAVQICLIHDVAVTFIGYRCIHILML